MAAFEKVKSGIDEMDPALDYIRMGDNVVWQVSSLDEFRVFAEAFAVQAVSCRAGSQGPKKPHLYPVCRT